MWTRVSIIQAIGGASEPVLLASAGSLSSSVRHGCGTTPLDSAVLRSGLSPAVPAVPVPAPPCSHAPLVLRWCAVCVACAATLSHGVSKQACNAVVIVENDTLVLLCSPPSLRPLPPPHSTSDFEHRPSVVGVRNAKPLCDQHLVMPMPSSSIAEPTPKVVRRAPVGEARAGDHDSDWPSSGLARCCKTAHPCAGDQRVDESPAEVVWGRQPNRTTAWRSNP